MCRVKNTATEGRAGACGAEAAAVAGAMRLRATRGLAGPRRPREASPHRRRLKSDALSVLGG
jgi:hypothetical protein